MAIERAELGSWRQWVLLAGLIVVLIVVLVMRRGGTPAPARAPQRASNSQRGAPAAQARPSAGDLDVQLEALDAKRTSPEAIERNPFRFEARRARDEDTPGSRGPVAPPPVAMPTVPAGPPPPPPIPLKFIGVIESPEAGRVAALTDGRHVFQGRAGDIIEGRYRIVRIGTESIVLEYVDGGHQQTIRLSGQ